MNTCFVDMQLVRCEQELSYFRRFRGAINSKRKAAVGDPELQWWFSDKPYTNMYLMRGDSHRTRAPEFETYQRTAVHNPIFVE